MISRGQRHVFGTWSCGVIFMLAINGESFTRMWGRRFLRYMYLPDTWAELNNVGSVISVNLVTKLVVGIYDPIPLDPTG